MKILLVTSRNLASSTGEWRLLAERAKAFSKYSVTTDLIYLYKAGRGAHIAAVHEWAGNWTCIGYKSTLSLPSALRRCMRKAMTWLSRNPRGQVLLSGLQLYPLAFALPKDKVVIDLHGTLEEWKENKSSIYRKRGLKYLFPLADFCERATLKRARQALVVSAPLQERAIAGGARNAWIIPCCLSSSERARYGEDRRAEWRSRLLLGEDDVAFIYCGGLSAWQCIDEMLKLFAQLRRYVLRARLFLATPDPVLSSHLALANGVDDAVCITLLPEDVPGALLACDVGLMLREKNKTNLHAFPNKFSEYLAANLFVIASSGTKDVAQIITDYDLGALVDPSEVRRGLDRWHLANLSAKILQADARQSRRQRSAVVFEGTLNMEKRAADFIQRLTSVTQH